MHKKRTTTLWLMLYWLYLTWPGFEAWGTSYHKERQTCQWLAQCRSYQVFWRTNEVQRRPSVKGHHSGYQSSGENRHSRQNWCRYEHFIMYPIVSQSYQIGGTSQHSTVMSINNYCIDQLWYHVVQCVSRWSSHGEMFTTQLTHYLHNSTHLRLRCVTIDNVVFR